MMIWPWFEQDMAADRYYTVDELMRILARDQGFWGSQGGVTFSGGEPLFQKEFILEVLKRCRANYIHTADEYRSINTRT
jgi:pyruvate formate lyase activating enzyme